MKLLIIEDSHSIAGHIRRQFFKEHMVDIAYTGKGGILKAKSEEYDIIILDLGLPDMSGLQVCKSLRKSGIHTPILVLTGKDEVVLKITLLSNGADDYLTKPFHIDELVARVWAISRRKGRRYHEDSLTTSGLKLNRITREVLRNNTLIRLRRKEFDILEYLLENKGRAMSREMILRHVWGADQDNWNNTVDVHIKRLRDMIDRDFSPPIIKTEHGIGYMVDDDT